MTNDDVSITAVTKANGRRYLTELYAIVSIEIDGYVYIVLLLNELVFLIMCIEKYNCNKFIFFVDNAVI